MAEIILSEKDIERFWSKVRKGGPDECWEWHGQLNRNGYGVFRRFRAHRVAWTLSRGPVDDALCCCHKCDNPPCVNPSHIFIGTRGDNVHDAVRKGRMPKGEQHPMCKMSDKTARRIVELLEDGVVMAKIARRLRVARWNVANIANGRSWAHLVGGKSLKRGSRRGGKHFCAKYGPRAGRKILNMWQAGYTKTEISLKLTGDKDRLHPVITKIVNGTHWSVRAP